MYSIQDRSCWRTELPLYFVDFQDGEKLAIDDLGSELENFQIARAQAIESLPEVAMNNLSKGGEDRNLITTIRGQDGTVLYRATLTFKGEHLIGGND